MKVRNELQNTSYHFADEEVIELFMYAYGYLDLASEGVLPVIVEDTPSSAELIRKFKQCFEGEFKVTKKIRRGKDER